MKFLLVVLLLLPSPAFAQFAYECFRPNGSTFVSSKKCPQGLHWRQIQTDPYYTVPVTRIYERSVQSTAPTVVTRQEFSSPTVVQGTVSQAPAAPVQPGYSNEELTKELNKRYEKYGGYKPGYTLTVGKDGKSYGWHK